MSVVLGVVTGELRKFTEVAKNAKKRVMRVQAYSRSSSWRQSKGLTLLSN